MALFVATSALATGAREALLVATLRAVRFVLVVWTGARVARALLFNVARSSACSAHCVSRGELAVLAAAVIGIVTNRPALVLACLRITTAVAAAGFLPATITLLAVLDYAVPALAGADGVHIMIGCETVRLDRIVKEASTNVANSTLREIRCLLRRARIHDVFALRIAR